MLFYCALHMFTNIKASIVIANEPARLNNIVSPAQMNLLSCSKYTTSSEKVENVVSPPQKPVVISIFQTGSRCVIRLNKANVRPIIKAPTRLTVRVPIGTLGDNPFNFMLISQRSVLPTPPPIKTASNVGNINTFLVIREFAERLRRNSTHLSEKVT